MGVLISKDLIDSYISDGEFVSVNNMLKEYDEIFLVFLSFINTFSEAAVRRCSSK